MAALGLGASTSSASLAERQLGGMGQRRHGGDVEASRHACGLNLNAAGSNQRSGRVLARGLFPVRSAAAVAAGAFVGDPGGLWGIRSGKLRGLPEY